MPTKAASGERPPQGTIVYLFAHQDDEIAVLHDIETALQGGARCAFLYLTNGNWAGADPEIRNRETLEILSRLGAAPDAAHFLGTQQAIPDGQLAGHFSKAIEGIRDALTRIGPVERFVMPAWEGGHQDHDAAHALGVKFAIEANALDRSRQFTLYRAATVGLLPYVVFRPLAANGRIIRSAIPSRRRLAYLRYCLIYATQRKTMAGLVPFMALDYLIDRHQKLQPVSSARLAERPHPGKLLYEKRGRASFEQVAAAIATLGFPVPIEISTAAHPPEPW